jgi:hypothetical protein
MFFPANKVRVSFLFILCSVFIDSLFRCHTITSVLLYNLNLNLKQRSMCRFYVKTLKRTSWSLDGVKLIDFTELYIVLLVSRSRNENKTYKNYKSSCSVIWIIGIWRALLPHILDKMSYFPYYICVSFSTKIFCITFWC